MGDGNMHWATVMKNLDGIDLCRAAGKIGVASVSCGPDFIQMMTAPSVATRGRIPLVVFAGSAYQCPRYSAASCRSPSWRSERSIQSRVSFSCTPFWPSRVRRLSKST